MSTWREPRTMVESREDGLAAEELSDFHVHWLTITKEDVDAFEKCLKRAKREEDVQRYLQKNPTMLIQHLGGGHGRWVMPKKRLGSEHVTDFVIGEKHSGGFDWQAVELESPKAKMFTTKGDPTAQLSHALKQIQEWRAWILRNQNYAARRRSEKGLGLIDITNRVPGFILIGRRRIEDEEFKDLRRQISSDNNVTIHSFDFLVDRGRDAAEAYKEWGFSKKRKRTVK